MFLKLSLVIFITISLVNSYLDLKTMHISIILNYLGLIICVVLNLILSPEFFFNNLCGSIILLLVFMLVWILSHKGLGFGDVHYSVFCGFISGVPGFIVSAFISSIIGLVVFLIIKIYSGKKSLKNIKVPFVPIMFIGTVCGLLFRIYYDFTI